MLIDFVCGWGGGHRVGELTRLIVAINNVYLANRKWGKKEAIKYKVMGRRNANMSVPRSRKDVKGLLLQLKAFNRIFYYSI